MRARWFRGCEYDGTFDIYISLIEDIISTYLWVWSLAAYATGIF